jgi:chorismate mutase
MPVPDAVERGDQREAFLAVPVAPLLVLAAERLILGVDVAAAKFVSGTPINDPVREKQTMDWVSRELRGMGNGREMGISFFRDQIEANKVIQSGLHNHWRANPEEFPVGWRSLTGEVRLQLDVINMHILLHVINIDHMSRPQFSLIEELFESRLRGNQSLRLLPEVQREAGIVALRSLSEGL